MPPLSEKFPDGLVTWWPQIKSTSWNEQNLQLQTRHPRKENRTPGDAEEREAMFLKKTNKSLEELPRATMTEIKMHLLTLNTEAEEAKISEIEQALEKIFHRFT